MSLLQLFRDYAEKGHPGNLSENVEVTSTDPAKPSGHLGNPGHPENNSNELQNRKNEIVNELKSQQVASEIIKKLTAAVYTYRTTERPEAQLTIITQGKTLDEVMRILQSRYGDRLLSVEPIKGINPRRL